MPFLLRFLANDFAFFSKGCKLSPSSQLFSNSTRRINILHMQEMQHKGTEFCDSKSVSARKRTPGRGTCLPKPASPQDEPVASGHRHHARQSPPHVPPARTHRWQQVPRASSSAPLHRAHLVVFISVHFLHASRPRPVRFLLHSASGCRPPRVVPLPALSPVFLPLARPPFRTPPPPPPGPTESPFCVCMCVRVCVLVPPPWTRL